MKSFFLACTLLLAAGFSGKLLAQKPVKPFKQYDSSYYQSYPHKVTARVFLSQKYNHYNFPSAGSADDLEYKANPKLNLGLGISVHNFSLNVFYGFAFLNKNDKPKGETKGLNIQLHVYPHKWAVDLYGEFPKGLHLDPKGTATTAGQYYYRPDIKSTLVGVSAYRVPNKERFSYRAAIVLTEWQKKSAGSWLYGGNLYYGSTQGDSALVPKVLQNTYPQAGITKINLFSVGPGGGYAYTAVLDQHFFITGSLVVNMNVNLTKEQSGSTNSNVTFNPATVFKAALGYNSSNWCVGVNWTGNGIWFKGKSSNEAYFWPSGNYRLVIAKRFNAR